MSQDQRPARVRVVSNSAAVSAPQRRRNDAVVRAAARADAAQTTRGQGRWAMVRVALFLLGCAGGGALVTTLLLRGIGQ